MSSAIWRLLKCGENFVKVESGHVLVVLGAPMRVLTTINNCHFNGKLCLNIKDVYFGKSENGFDVLCRNNICVHINHSIYYFRHSHIFKESCAYVWLENGTIYKLPNARWLAYCDIHILP